MHKHDHKAEFDAIRAYNENIQVGDNSSREMLESILKDGESHIDLIEAQQDQIRQMGIRNYLVEQID